VKEINNINYILKKDICVSCGACRVICPQKCIEVGEQKRNYKPRVDVSRCINCKMCLEVCPSYKVDYNEFAPSNRNILLGEYTDIFAGYIDVNDERIKSTSGGIITNLLKYLINSGLVDAVTVVPSITSINEQVKMIVTNNIGDVEDGRGSKYTNVDISECIKYIVQNSEKKVALVGTSCQFESVKKIIKMRNLNEENYLFIGIFCSKTLNHNVLKYYNSKFTPNGHDIDRFVFRSKIRNGAPGETLIQVGEKKTYIENSFRRNISDYFKNARCLYCFDRNNHLSDISIGDCFVEGFDSDLGESIVIVRNEKGKNLIDLLDNVRRIELNAEFLSEHCHNKSDERKLRLAANKGIIINSSNNKLIKNDSKIVFIQRLKSKIGYSITNIYILDKLMKVMNKLF